MLRSFFKPKVQYYSYPNDFEIGFYVLLTGILGGIGAVAFRYLLAETKWICFDKSKVLTGILGGWYVILVPVIGMVIVSYIVNRWAVEAKGHGVPEVQYAVRKQGGQIRPRVAIVKILASAICIGTGGSVGREGPIVQIGAALGSFFGKFRRLPKNLIRLLVACGAAAGISATFNAPISGVIFALEIILGGFSGRSFGFIVVSSIAATAIRRAIMGNSPTFDLTQVFQLRSSLELPLYLLMGLILGVVSFLFVKSVYFIEDVIEKVPIHVHFKAAIGGLTIGLLGYFGSPFLFGVGYDGINSCLHDGIIIQMMLLLVVLKMMATAVTLGAEGSGGIFSPSLFIGAMAGGAYGVLVHYLFPGVCASPGAYSLVGMAAVFAGTAQAPITAIVILFEMTKDYQVILPIMLAAVVSYFSASKLGKDSMYFVKLRRLGGLEPELLPSSMLDQILVADAMITEFPTVEFNTPVTGFAQRIYPSPNEIFPVLDGEGYLLGMVSVKDVENVLSDGKATNKTIADIMTRELLTCTPEQSLRLVLEKIEGTSVMALPVVDSRDKRILHGILTEETILWAFSELSREYHLYYDQRGQDLTNV